MNDVYIIEAQRTPIGQFQGGLKSLSAPKLGALAIAAALERSGLSKEVVEEVYMGQVLTAGCGQAPARQAALGASLPYQTRTTTVGKVCGSGLVAVALAAQSIGVGQADIAVAGGQESMSQAPYLANGAREGWRMGHKQMTDSLVLDGLWDPYNQLHMGSCAEFCAQKYNISRERQDAFAKESYGRALLAQKEGLFKREIIPISVFLGKNETLVAADEEPPLGDFAKIPLLRPAFQIDGTITAANASKINDGAAALVLASQIAVQKHGLRPLAKILGYASHAQDPKWFTTAPQGAISKVLQKTGLSVEQIDLFEINEAFAVVPLVAMEQMGIEIQKVNVHGGACALGHPIGASGARILTTLLYALEKKDKKYGLATLCIGGGEAFALVVERIEH